MIDTQTEPGPILGVDPSLVGCGMALLPSGWTGSWDHVARATVGYSLPQSSKCSDHITRLEYLSAKVLAFAREHGVTHVGLESFPFGKTSAAWSLGRLHGVLMVDLSRAGFVVHSVPISSARKIFLGKLPRKAAKQAIADHWARLKAPWATLDECDAAACANYLSAQLGGSYFNVGRLWLPRETEGAA